MRAGTLRHRCTLQRAEETRLPGGGRSTAWTAIGELWAEIGVLSGRFVAVAEKIDAEVSAEILVRNRPDIAAGMRLVHKSTGETYLIKAPLRDNRREMLRLLCSNVINP